MTNWNSSINNLFLQEILIDANLENIKFRIKIMVHNEGILDNFVENKKRSVSFMFYSHIPW